MSDFKDNEEADIEDKESKGFSQKITSFLSAWEGSNSTSHKLIVVSTIFLVIMSFLVYRLTTAMDDKPLFTDNEAERERAIRMSNISKKTDSLDKVQDLIENRKEALIRQYKNNEVKKTRNEYKPLNEKK